MIEQRFEANKTLDLAVGIPVVLIDKTTAPAANFQFNVHFRDVTHVIFPGRKFADNVSVSMTLGVPFSKIIY